MGSNQKGEAVKWFVSEPQPLLGAELPGALRAVIANHKYAFDRDCAYYETGCGCSECIARRALAEIEALKSGLPS